jgi:integrase
MRGCIIKRGAKSWAVVVYLGRDPQTGKDRQKWYSYPTRREAEAHLAQLLVHVQAGGTVPNTKVRIGDYLEQWLRDSAAPAVRPTTLKSYQDTIRLHLSPALGHLRLQQLTPQAVQKYVADKLKAPRVGPERDKPLLPLSATSVRYHATVLHAAMRHAVKWGLIPRNPVDLVERPRRQQPEMRTWDEEQTRLFLGEAKRSSPHYTLYLAAVTTGMRQGELLGLRRQDVDLTFGVASVRQTLYRLAGNKKEQRPGRLLLAEPKTATGRRTVALPPVMVGELRTLFARQDAARKTCGDCPDGTACAKADCAEWHPFGLVFCQPNGKPLHAHNITQGDFRRVLGLERLRAEMRKQMVSEEALPKPLPTIRFHDLRHCHATLLLSQGVNVKVVQERLGHATPAFTLHVYGHVLPGMQEEAARAFEERLLQATSPHRPLIDVQR